MKTSPKTAPSADRGAVLAAFRRALAWEMHVLRRDPELRVRGTGSDALDPKERQFLDNMARVGRAKPRSSENVAAPQPRERGESQETLVPHSPTPANASGRGSADRSRS
jgi:hypothetical protein